MFQLPCGLVCGIRRNANLLISRLVQLVDICRTFCDNLFDGLRCDVVDIDTICCMKRLDRQRRDFECDEDQNQPGHKRRNESAWLALRAAYFRLSLSSERNARTAPFKSCFIVKRHSFNFALTCLCNSTDNLKEIKCSSGFGDR